MKYLLTFKPLKNFFFGNNRTFSNDYVAVSDYFPQNTQLLGALRLFIAEQNKLMHVHRNGKYSNEPNKLKTLIGRASAKDFQSNQDLGKIQNLSSMFIVNSDLSDAYFPTPFDIEVKENHVRYYTLSHFEENYFLKDYDAKQNTPASLANGSFWQKYIKRQPLTSDEIIYYDKLFVKHTQVGIQLEQKRTVDGAFYSKRDYQLEAHKLFAAVIELEEELMVDGIIQIGAEGSLFALKVHRLAETPLTEHPIVSTLFSPPTAGEKVVALSDVMISDTSDIESVFSIVPYYRQFANLNYKDVKGADNRTLYRNFKGKTEQKRVIPKGSVFYFSKASYPKNETLGAYKKMGYNQFLTVQK